MKSALFKKTTLDFFKVSIFVETAAVSGLKMRSACLNKGKCVGFCLYGFWHVKFFNPTQN